MKWSLCILCVSVNLWNVTLKPLSTETTHHGDTENAQRRITAEV